MSRLSEGAVRFCTKYPRLFHVTDEGSTALIREHGLLPAEALCVRFEVPASERDRLLAENRRDYVRLHHPELGEAWLRRQYAWDEAMRTRLRDGLTPAGWRRFLNQHVFFHVHAQKALKFAAHEEKQGRKQTVLWWATRGLLDAGLSLLACRWNNGMVDRSPAHIRRKRGEEDYVPLDALDLSLPVAEVVVQAIVPRSISFKLLSAEP